MYFLGEENNVLFICLMFLRIPSLALSFWEKFLISLHKHRFVGLQLILSNVAIVSTVISADEEQEVRQMERAAE